MTHVILYQDRNWILNDIKEKIESTNTHGLWGLKEYDLVSFNKTQMSGLNSQKEKVMFVHIDDTEKLRGLKLNSFVFHHGMDLETVNVGEISELCCSRMR